MKRTRKQHLPLSRNNVAEEVFPIADRHKAQIQWSTPLAITERNLNRINIVHRLRLLLLLLLRWLRRQRQLTRGHWLLCLREGL